MAERGGARRSRTQHERRREEIDKIAARLFAEKGYHATSIRDLSDATGLKRGALYHYIDGKEDVLFRIHERFIEPLLEEARAIEAAGDPPSDTLRALARALLRDIGSYRDEVTVFLHEWRTIKKDGRWDRVREARREFESVVERTLRRGVAARSEER